MFCAESTVFSKDGSDPHLVVVARNIAAGVSVASKWTTVSGLRRGVLGEHPDSFSLALPLPALLTDGPLSYGDRYQRKDHAGLQEGSHGGDGGDSGQDQCQR